VQQYFSSTRVIVPVDAGLSVLLGTVLFGHSPLVITSRVTQKTYGVVLDALFNEEKHPVSRIFDHEGTCYCYGMGLGFLFLEYLFNDNFCRCNTWVSPH
jgi:hypothetical protein